MNGKISNEVVRCVLGIEVDIDSIKGIVLNGRKKSCYTIQSGYGEITFEISEKPIIDENVDEYTMNKEKKKDIVNKKKNFDELKQI
ncbi:13034_t:CDS:2, partial [Dentiscutata erythropus]